MPITKINNALKDLFSKSEIRSLTHVIMEKLTGMTPTEVMAADEITLTERQQNHLDDILRLLQENKPIQYILGETSFCGHTIWVDENVLIPRPETEELVEWIKSSETLDGRKFILDVGTGSGCIAIALNYIFPKSKVFAFDVSLDALNTAHENAALHSKYITFCHINILKIETWKKPFDLIVSNPPYITNAEKADMEENVLNYEPDIALFVHDNDPIVFYREIARFGTRTLNPNGKVYFEINRMFGNEVVEMMKELGYEDVELKKDISNNDRFVRGTWRGSKKSV